MATLAIEHSSRDKVIKLESVETVIKNAAKLTTFQLAMPVAILPIFEFGSV